MALCSHLDSFYHSNRQNHPADLDTDAIDVIYTATLGFSPFPVACPEITHADTT